MSGTKNPGMMRTFLGRARGSGSARAGLDHWRAQRLTAIALLPLTIYFVISVLVLLGADQATMIAYMHKPWNAVLFLSLIASLFYHLHLGLQVVIEDYVQDSVRRVGTLLAMRGLVILFGVLAGYAVLKLAI